MAEDSKKVECINSVERLRKAIDEMKRAVLGSATTQNFEQLDRPIGKVIATNVSDSVGRRMAEGLGYNCRCVMGATGAPRNSGRYPWKDDDNEIRKVLNMDSTRFNRFVSMLDAAGGNFSMEGSTDVNPMVKIEIPYSMLYHLHIDGDGSVIFDPDGPFSHSSGRIPAIRQIQTFNDRVVQITFIDGTKTKCVCGKDETFDLYEGIAFCLFKRFLDEEDGTKHFNDLMRYAFKKLDKQEENKKREAEIEAEKKRREEKKKLQAQRRKAKKREEKIGIFVEALRKNREIMMEEGWAPMVKPDEKAIDGSTIFFDPLSGKTFTSSRDKILLAVETLNNRILEHDWVSVNEWYEELGLDSSGNLGESMGWNIDHLMQIDFAADFTSDGRNCYTIIYDEKPIRYGEGKA